MMKRSAKSPAQHSPFEVGFADHLPFVAVCCHELAPQVERSFENRTKHRFNTDVTCIRVAFLLRVLLTVTEAAQISDLNRRPGAPTPAHT